MSTNLEPNLFLTLKVGEFSPVFSHRFMCKWFFCWKMQNLEIFSWKYHQKYHCAVTSCFHIGPNTRPCTGCVICLCLWKCDLMRFLEMWFDETFESVIWWDFWKCDLTRFLEMYTGETTGVIYRTSCVWQCWLWLCWLHLCDFSPRCVFFSNVTMWVRKVWYIEHHVCDRVGSHPALFQALSQLEWVVCWWPFFKRCSNCVKLWHHALKISNAMCLVAFWRNSQLKQTLTWPWIWPPSIILSTRGLPQNCPLPLMLGLGSGLCPLATCSKQSIPATSVAKGSLEQLSEI